jgi:entericidin B
MFDNVQNITGERRISVMKRRATTAACFDPDFHDRRPAMIRKIFATLLATLFLAGVFGTLAGCNTVEGAGKDIEQGGKSISNEARENKDKR